MGGRGTWSTAWHRRSRLHISAGRDTAINEAEAAPVPTGYIVPQIDQSMFSSTLRTPAPSNNTDLAISLFVADVGRVSEPTSIDQSASNEIAANSPLPYTIIDQSAALCAATYPFLQHTVRPAP